MNTNKAIANLANMKLSELQAMFTEVIGEKTRSHNKTFLVRKLSKALEVVSDGSEETSTNPGAGTAIELADVVSTTAATVPAAKKLTGLDVPQLQARCLEVVGRSSGSSNKAYLIWRIREARKGRVPMGPRKNAHREDVTFKILPLRLEAAIVDKLDQVWKRLGLHSRADLFRKSLHVFLRSSGENEVAALLAEEVWRKQ